VNRTELATALHGIRVIPLTKLALRLGFVSVLIIPAGSQTAKPTIESSVKALQAGDPQTAYAIAQKLIETKPGDVKAWLLLGTSLSGLKRNTESLRAFHRALDLQPDSLAALEGAVQAAYAIQSPEAERLLQRVLAVDPRNETAHAMLGALAFRATKCDDAVAHYQQAQKALANNVAALSEYGICLVETHREDTAVSIFERILQLRPDNWQNRYNLALVHYRARHYAESIETLKPVAEAPAPNSEVLNLLAAAYEANHDTQRAVATLYRAIAAAPEDARSYLDLATLCMEHSAEQTGLDIVNAALKKLPDALELYLERAVLYIQVGKFAEAQADFDEVDRRRPQQTLATLGRGIALLQTNRQTESLGLIRERLKASPNDATLNYLLAEVQSRSNAVSGQAALREAIAAAERAVKIKPDFVLAHDVLAGLLLKSGELDRSIAESRLSLKVDPTDRTAVYHLLSAWRKRGNDAEVATLAKQLRTMIEQARLDQVEKNKFRIVERQKE
jgi:tetratricopeptide (TPR) repeat protein